MKQFIWHHKKVVLTSTLFIFMPCLFFSFQKIYGEKEKVCRSITHKKLIFISCILFKEEKVKNAIFFIANKQFTTVTRGSSLSELLSQSFYHHFKNRLKSFALLWTSASATLLPVLPVSSANFLHSMILCVCELWTVR